MIEPDSTAARRRLRDLLAECQAQMALFRADEANDPTPCITLFQVAILRRDPDAWAALVTIYRSRVERTILRYARADAEQLADLTQQALVKFWLSYTADRLARSQSIGEILAYWDDCCRSIALDYVRREQRAAPHRGRSLDEPAETDEGSRETDPPGPRDVPRDVARARARARLWELVERACKDERERVIAQVMFVEGGKPREVFALRRDLFAEVKDVFRSVRNLKERLSRIPELAELLDELRDSA